MAVRHLRAQGTRFEVRCMGSGFTLAEFADWLQRKGQVGFRLRTSGNGPREQGESKREPIARFAVNRWRADSHRHALS